MAIPITDKPRDIPLDQDIKVQMQLIQRNFADLWNKVSAVADLANQLEKKLK